MAQRIDFTKYVVPQKLKNNGGGWVRNEKTLDTTDLVYINSINDVKNLALKDVQTTATDHALDNCALQKFPNYKDDKLTTKIWLRSAVDQYEVYDVEYSGSQHWEGPHDFYIATRPVLTVNLEPLMSSSEAPNFKDILVEKNGKHFLQIGEYPKTTVSPKLSKKLEELFNHGNLKKGLTCTGRLFSTNGQRIEYLDYLTREIPEFEYEGKRYVRDVVRRNDGLSRIYEDGRKVPEMDSVQWKSVEPVSFEITNWEKFWSTEKAIQKNGLIKENKKFWANHELKLVAEEAVLAGIPFYPHYDHEYCSLWQNSLIRCFLQSAKSEELDGNPNAKTPFKWDFRGRGFLHEAFNMLREPTKIFTIPESESEIAPFAFFGCVGIEQIVLHNGIKKIGARALDFINFKYIYFSKDGKTTIFSKLIDKKLEKTCLRRDYTPQNREKAINANYRKNDILINLWKEANKIKFIPPEYTIEIFPTGEISKYFVNNNSGRWGKLVKTLGLDKLDGPEKYNSLVDLMKIYYAIGGFSENQGESENAYNYILKYVARVRRKSIFSQSGYKYIEKPKPREIGAEIHSRFSKLVLNGPYNPVFAQFFMKYYGDNPDFMCVETIDEDGQLVDIVDYLCQAHNNFDRIVKSYPNRVVNGNEERALLTPEFVAAHSVMAEYDYVDVGNELLAETVGRFGYTQEQFDRIQDIYNTAKKIKDKFVIQADKALGTNGITFRILEKDDPLGFVIGDITNCCQHIDGASDSCVDDGYTNPNAGFIVFEKSKIDEHGDPTGESKILGQAYVWYDPQTKTVCFDNIEIPTKVLHELRSGTNQKTELSTTALMQVVVESANAIMRKMNEQGIQVDRVTTGEGYSDLKRELAENFPREVFPQAKHRGYCGYSDADRAQYVIATYDQRTKETASQIRKIVKHAKKDLEEMRSNNGPALGD